jgi:hypothetical protein
VSVPRLPLPGRVPGRQDDIAALVQSTDGVRFTLAFLDTRTRRLATFVERSKVPSVWVVPIDLSSPPRRLAELTGDPSLCHAPLASSDGHHIGFTETSQGGTTARITVTVE